MFRLIKSAALVVMYLLRCRPEPEVFTDMSRFRREQLIDEWIISERDRNIMKRRFLDKIKIEAIAEEFDMSDRQIKNILRKCQNEIAIHL